MQLFACGRYHSQGWHLVVILGADISGLFIIGVEILKLYDLLHPACLSHSNLASGENGQLLFKAIMRLI